MQKPTIYAYLAFLGFSHWACKNTINSSLDSKTIFFYVCEVMVLQFYFLVLFANLSASLQLPYQDLIHLMMIAPSVICQVLPKLTCDHCGKSFSRRSTLEQHLASHDTHNTSWEDVQVHITYTITRHVYVGRYSLTAQNQLGRRHWYIDTARLQILGCTLGHELKDRQNGSV